MHASFKQIEPGYYKRKWYMPGRKFGRDTTGIIYIAFRKLFLTLVFSSRNQFFPLGDESWYVMILSREKQLMGMQYYCTSWWWARSEEGGSGVSVEVAKHGNEDWAGLTNKRGLVVEPSQLVSSFLKWFVRNLFIILHPEVSCMN